VKTTTVPGHIQSRQDCIYTTQNSVAVDRPLNEMLPPHCFDASRRTAGDNETEVHTTVNPQVYAAKVVHEAAMMTSLNASWTVPNSPSTWYGFGYVNYFWPGFKAKQPVIGFPVLQPVLQYGQNGAAWEVQSWFVSQQGHGAASANAPAIQDVISGDIIDSYMIFNKATRYWTVYAENRRNKQFSNLTISLEAAGNTTYEYGMFVYENILTPKACNQLPADVDGVTFFDISLNAETKVNWTTTYGRTDCDFKVDINASTSAVHMSWSNVGAAAHVPDPSERDAFL